MKKLVLFITLMSGIGSPVILKAQDLLDWRMAIPLPSLFGEKCELDPVSIGKAALVTLGGGEWRLEDETTRSSSVEYLFDLSKNPGPGVRLSISMFPDHASAAAAFSKMEELVRLLQADAKITPKNVAGMDKSFLLLKSNQFREDHILFRNVMVKVVGLKGIEAKELDAAILRYAGHLQNPDFKDIPEPQQRRFPSGLTIPSEFREWTSADGKVIKASVVSFDADSRIVTLKGDSGKVFPGVPISKLSNADQEFFKGEAQIPGGADYGVRVISLSRGADGRACNIIFTATRGAFWKSGDFIDPSGKVSRFFARIDATVFQELWDGQNLAGINGQPLPEGKKLDPGDFLVVLFNEEPLNRREGRGKIKSFEIATNGMLEEVNKWLSNASEGLPDWVKGN